MVETTNTDITNNPNFGYLVLGIIIMFHVLALVFWIIKMLQELSPKKRNDKSN